MAGGFIDLSNPLNDSSTILAVFRLFFSAVDFSRISKIFSNSQEYKKFLHSQEYKIFSYSQEY